MLNNVLGGFKKLKRYAITLAITVRSESLKGTVFMEISCIYQD
jgi:hypothetical protein